MGSKKPVAIAITDLIIRKIAELAPQLFIGAFVASESIDSNLSQVQSGNNLYRYVPKLSSATLASGDQVLVIKGIGTPMIIVGKIVGDISLVQF